MEILSTQELSVLIYQKILSKRECLTAAYKASESTIGYFYIDDLLPIEIAKACFEVFPKPSEMRRLKSLKEYKHVSAQMDLHHALLEGVIFAFQNEKIVQLISDICGIDALSADQSLYAGGLSLMAKHNFLHPHLDNSHNASRERWRVLNLLYYVTPHWNLENGGHLELWPEGPLQKPVRIESKFNRLVVMATHNASWHSVNQVTVDDHRCCISNYYFSASPLKSSDTFHVTKFRSRPGNSLTTILLECDSTLRMLLRKVFKKGVRKNPHVYKKD